MIYACRVPDLRSEKNSMLTVSCQYWYLNDYQTHLGMMTSTTAENLIIFGSGNGFSPVWHQTITWTNDDPLSFGHLGKQLMRNESKCNDFHYGKCIWKVIYKSVANLFRLRWVNTNIYKNTRQYWLISIWLTYMAILQGHGKFIHIIWWFNQIFHFVWSFMPHHCEYEYHFHTFVLYFTDV